ncbi:MAG: SAM-dependent methyltransferase [bacterium]
MTTDTTHDSSFRDPSGFLFYRNGIIYRQINNTYKIHYDLLMSSGLYGDLTGKGLLIPHEEADIAPEVPSAAYKIIKPDFVPFISYPYEWSFSQLKDAALLTLGIQKAAIEFDMTLKDCSAYNVQYMNGKPVFIDTLSFEKLEEGEPWVAYKQFCQHFLAPLALMSYKDIRLNQLLRIFIDGVPLDLASGLLPFSTRFKFSLLTNIHLHAKSQGHYADKGIGTSTRKVSRMGLLGLIDSLESAVKKLSWSPQGTEWADYYNDTNYSKEAFERKKQIVSDFIDELGPKSLWDLGANNGTFSRIASEKGIQTISGDIDPAAVELNYLQCKKNGGDNLLPLLLDLTNPSPGIGWRNSERSSLIERGPADAALALALIHHLAISNNVPLPRIAAFFSAICRNLIIEFVPKNDSQVQRLLSSRKDIFDDYTQEAFEKSFSDFFAIAKTERLSDSGRTLYLMRRKGNPV